MNCLRLESRISQQKMGSESRGIGIGFTMPHHVNIFDSRIYTNQMQTNEMAKILVIHGCQRSFNVDSTQTEQHQNKPVNKKFVSKSTAAAAINLIPLINPVLIEFIKNKAQFHFHK